MSLRNLLAVVYSVRVDAFTRGFSLPDDGLFKGAVLSVSYYKVSVNPGQ